MSRDTWPPGGRDGEGRATPDPANVEELLPSSPTPQPHDKRAQRQCSPETWMRRLACGCRDPLFCECRPPLIESPPLTEKMIDAGAQAARHLLDIGLVPLL